MGIERNLLHNTKKKISREEKKASKDHPNYGNEGITAVPKGSNKYPVVRCEYLNNADITRVDKFREIVTNIEDPFSRWEENSDVCEKAIELGLPSDCESTESDSYNGNCPIHMDSRMEESNVYNGAQPMGMSSYSYGTSGVVAFPNNWSFSEVNSNVEYNNNNSCIQPMGMSSYSYGIPERVVSPNNESFSEVNSNVEYNNNNNCANPYEMDPNSDEIFFDGASIYKLYSSDVNISPYPNEMDFSSNGMFLENISMYEFYPSDLSSINNDSNMNLHI